MTDSLQDQPLAERNKALVRRYFVEIMNGNHQPAFDELLAPDFLFTLPTHPEPYHGPDGFRELVGMLHGAFPNFYIFPQDMVADGDTVVTRWRGGGAHLGGALHTTEGDIPATHKSFEIDGMTWHRVAGGKIVEALGNEDTVGLLMQLGVAPIPPADGVHTTPEQNQALAKRYFEEIMNAGKLDTIPAVVDPNFQFIIPTQPEPFRGVEGFTGFVTYLRSAFPDIRFTVEREIAAGNKVASRWKIEATHKGEFLGAPATGNHIEDHGVDIFTFGNGKILTVHVNENDFGLMKQLGMI